MKNQSGASKSPLSTPQPKDKGINLNSSASPSNIKINEPPSFLENHNNPWFQETVEPKKRPNGNGKNKVIDLSMQRHGKEYDDDQSNSNGVKKFVEKYYKKNPDDGWTDEEHELFLMGLLKYGISNYRKISKKYVKTKDPEQVENHAELVFKTSGQTLKSSPRKVRRTEAKIAMANAAAANFASNSYLVVPYVADAASGTDGVVEAETANNIVVDQIVGTTTHTRTLELFPTSLPPPRPTLIVFPVVASGFTVRSGTGSSNAPPSYASESNRQDMPNYGTFGPNLFPSHGDHQLDLDLALGSLEKVNWSFEENKMFEYSIAELDPGSPDCFERIAERIPAKTLKQIEDHFQILIEDIEMIESGRIPLPNYGTNSGDKGKGPNSNDKPNQRKKGVPWTEKEHELFLNGLKRYGKGDWRSISRNCVVTRTPSQVASHAQKYFLRLQNSGNTEHKQKYSSTSRHRRRNSSSSTSSTTSKAAESMAAAPSPQLSVPTPTCNELAAIPFPQFFGDRDVPSSVTDRTFAAFPPDLDRHY
ncbi:unnamed protein product [Dovyalis caffra]|uniref:Uncharacterized protein n=1 Tax=Dovyalis caffra TaxID=77055 RepID=A0AAV1SS27_9ROSI|nr:unnamed protein product [Dovyalis caffra]